MKRITTLILAVAFALGSVNAAYADGVDVKVKGYWDFAFGWVDNGVFKDSVHGDTGRSDNDKFLSRQRVRTQINFISSESLQGVLMFEIGNLNWGRGYNANGKSGQGAGGGLDTDGVNIETKHAYLDWIIPNTEVSVRMGLQPLKAPAVWMGTPWLNADMAAITVSSPITDWLSATAFWGRPFDAYADTGTRSVNGNNISDSVDVFALLLPFSFDGIGNFTPFFAYSWVGAGSGIYDYMFRSNSVPTNTVTASDSRSKLWYLGGNFNMTILDPLVFGLDVIYGHLSTADVGGLGGMPQGTHVGTSGWFIAGTLDYKLDWGTPGIFGWWGSGDDANAMDSGKLGRLPSFMVDGGLWEVTHFGAGSSAIGDELYVTGTATGTWAVGVQLANVSFIQDLKHTLRVLYYRGTNDSDGVANHGYLPYAYDSLYLTDKDSVWEVNFDHQYKIYENLTALLELGYLHLTSDQDTWRGYKAGSGYDEHDDAWKAEINLRYSF